VGGKLVESSSLNYMESDTMWIHPKCAPPHAHLYINNLYPPEYAELDQARLTGQHDTCYASTDLLEQHYNQVKRDLALAHCDRVSHLVEFYFTLR
jgi:hypothetical protein